jgi:hypothetical protein
VVYWQPISSWDAIRLLVVCGIEILESIQTFELYSLSAARKSLQERCSEFACSWIHAKALHRPIAPLQHMYQIPPLIGTTARVGIDMACFHGGHSLHWVVQHNAKLLLSSAWSLQQQNWSQSLGAVRSQHDGCSSGTVWYS